MNEKILKALVEAGAVKKITVIADGSTIYVEASAGSELVTAKTTKGQLKTWRSIDSAVKWVRSLRVGQLQLNVDKWQPQQKGFKV